MAETVEDILRAVRYKDWMFLVDGLVLQVQFPDSNGVQRKGRKWNLSEHMTRSEVVQTALKAVLTAEEHEVREQFTYRGQAIFGPHFDVEALVVLSAEQRLDIRKGTKK